MNLEGEREEILRGRGRLGKKRKCADNIKMGLREVSYEDTTCKNLKKMTASNGGCLSFRH
jgi:hypothetical protein